VSFYAIAESLIASSDWRSFLNPLFQKTEALRPFKERFEAEAKKSDPSLSLYPCDEGLKLIIHDLEKAAKNLMPHQSVSLTSFLSFAQLIFIAGNVLWPLEVVLFEIFHSILFRIWKLRNQTFSSGFEGLASKGMTDLMGTREITSGKRIRKQDVSPSLGR